MRRPRRAGTDNRKNQETGLCPRGGTAATERKNEKATTDHPTERHERAEATGTKGLAVGNHHREPCQDTSGHAGGGKVRAGLRA